MKHFIEFKLFESSNTRSSEGNNIDSDHFAEALRRWPQFAPPPGLCGLHVRVEVSDPILGELSAFLESCGRRIELRRFPSAYGRDKEVIYLKGIRELETADLDAAPILWGSPVPLICRDDGYAPDGSITITGTSLTKRDVGRAGTRFCCSDKMRQLMEAESFAGLTFDPVQIIGKCKISTPIWQLTSDIVLPPVLTGAVNEQGQPHDFKPGFYGCVNDIFWWQVLLYPENLFSLVPAFDVARTTEAWFIKRYPHRQPTLVFSQRFRQFCLKHKIPMEWYWAQIGGEYPNPFPDKNPVYAPGYTPPPPSQPLFLR